MRVLAIGATGFIGPHVVRQLVANGHTVAVMHRGSSTADLPAGVHVFRGAHASMGDLRDELARWRPDVVLDLIAYTQADAELLVETLHGITRHVTVLSSADVYRNYDGLRGRSDHEPDPGALAEDAPLREHLFPYRGLEEIRFPYRDDYDKILVEATLLECPEVCATVLRLPAVYGPRDRQHRLRPLLMRMEASRPAIVLEAAQAQWRWSRGYVGNVAAAIAHAATRTGDTDAIMNVADEPALTELEWVQRIGHLMDWKGKVLVLDEKDLPRALKQEADWRYHLALDTRRLSEDLGFQPPVPPLEGLRRAIEWERSVMDVAASPDYTSEDEVISRFLPTDGPGSVAPSR